MTAFYDLPFFPRSMFGLWAFLLCCAGIVGIILSFVFGRYRYALLSVVSLAPAYFLWQVIFNIYRVIKNNPVVALDPSARWLGKLPWLIWVLAFIPLTLAALWAMHLNVRYSRAFITPLAIKQCGDKMPCGICYWLDNGRVIFSNICMNGLCLALTGEPLLNGNSFRNALTEGTQRVRDEVWRFTFRDLTFNGRLLHEMVAWDVTEIHAKTEALRRDNEELSRMTEKLKAYSLKIDDVVHRQEVLQAKVNIHDEMNHLMLSTVAADEKDEEAMDRFFTRWQKNALLLCMEAEKKNDNNALDALYGFARLLGISLRINGTIPESLPESQRDLFHAAAQEAIVNAVKHAEAKSLTVSFERSEDGIRCVFENRGNVRAGDVRFTGGLANLLMLAKEQNAVLSAKAGETFRLSLFFLKSENMCQSAHAHLGSEVLNTIIAE